MIERALCCGDTVLIENLPEKVDPVLEPLLGRNTLKKGRLVVKLQQHIHTLLPMNVINGRMGAFSKVA